MKETSTDKTSAITKAIHTSQVPHIPKWKTNIIICQRTAQGTRSRPIVLTDNGKMLGKQ